MDLYRFICAALACATSTAIWTFAPTTGHTEQTTFVIPQQSVLFLAANIAEGQHLWANQGLDVKIEYIAGVGTANAVIGGSADFSFGSGSTITRAAARGQKLVALLTGITASGQSIVIRKSIADAAHFDPSARLVERGKILKGKRIGGAYVGTLPDIILKVVAKDAGLAPNEFVGSPMAPTEMLAAFANGSVDGFVSNPPYVDQVLIDGTGALVSDTRKHEPEEFSPSSGSLLLARADFCAKSRSVCEKMVHGLYEAVRTIRNDSNTSLAVMKTGFGTYTEKVRESAYETLKSITPDNPITSAEALENGDKMNVAAGFMRPEDMLADYKALINNEFVK